MLAALLVSGGLAACGKHPNVDGPVVQIEGEGLYLELGELKYQVQISRQLNPDDIQDRSYLLGLPAAERKLEPDEVWFGVFMQVENEADVPRRPSGDIEIVDTQEDTFKPVAVNDTNAWVYRSTELIPPKELAPLPDTPAYDTPIQGSLLLFKLTLEALDNRPLELKIEATDPRQTGIIDLDV